VAEQMTGEAPDRHESTVTRRHSIASLSLDMLQEGEYGVGVDVVETDVGDGPRAAASQKHEEESERVAVGPDGVIARPTRPPQILMEEALHQYE
jgi:hypothetical protein